jgi:MFS family permease
VVHKGVAALKNSPVPLGPLLWLTFLESFGTVLLERALYFFASDVLDFQDIENLWLAFAFGVTYVLGALGSHRAAIAIGERRLLVLSLIALFVVHGVLVRAPTALFVTIAFPIIGFLQGIKWPVVESFMSAGRPPRELVREIGRYNTVWGVSVPLAMASSGPLIALGPGLMFGAAAVLNLAAATLALPLPARPAHLDQAHPERPQPGELTRLGALLASARWSMLLSYALLFLLAPLMPQVFARLGLPITQATAAAGLLDVGRVACFAAVGAWVGWRGRPLPLVLSVFVLPLAFFLILFGNSLWLVLFGELLYGLAAGFTYTAALYYALLVKNASVDAGGAHEGLIGLGFALGPLAGIAAHALGSASGSELLAMLACVAPLMLLCSVQGLRPLRAVARRA